MRRREQLLDDKRSIEEILTQALVCRLGLSKDNIPYVVPVCFGYENDTIYVHSSALGTKMDFIASNNHVCVEADINVEMVEGDPTCRWSVKYLSVIGFGRAFIITDHKEKIKALDVIMRHYSNESHFTYDDSAIDKVSIIKIKIESITGKKSRS
jgi:uncharacterized protein